VKILLIGGGTGGHITPLLAVARELKDLEPTVELIGICEKQSKFVELYRNEPSIKHIYQVRAGKYRRYAGLKWYQRLFDVRTLLLNIRDIFKTSSGYFEAKGLIKRLKPDILLIKGGFVGVPVGLAAHRLGIPFITHDSDSTPGLANRLISRWAAIHATGMPKELYRYPQEKTVYTGIPVSNSFSKLTPKLKAEYRSDLGLGSCRQIITVIGGSQGASQLNEDMVTIVGRMMQKHEGLGLVHIAGKVHELTVRRHYESELLADERQRVVVKGFVADPAVHTGVADIVITRASATVLAELALQSMPAVLVPGRLASGHQDENAAYFSKAGAAVTVAYGDSEGLYRILDDLLTDPHRLKSLGDQLHKLAKPRAARELAELVYRTAGRK
jgi:UDP-N-acetylglucosamine--N-acetylmuramyl-(pentapeptide) pyrophosphoryl-undecaprenol N-acetylglucosamine transferase